MKLALVNGSSYLAQGVLKRIVNNNIYKEITIIDYFKNSDRFNRVYKCLDQLDNNSNITWKKYENKNSLKNALEGHNHMLYLTHDYQDLAPCKNHILDNTIEFNDKFEYSLFVNLLEYSKFNNNDNYFEDLNNNINKIKLNCKNSSILNTPVTYGDYSDSFNNYLVNYLLNNKSLYIYNNYNEIPLINSTELFTLVEDILKNKKIGNFNLVSNEKRSIKSILEILEKSLGGISNINDLKSRLLVPTDSNLVNELFYSSEFMNYMKMFNSLGTNNYEVKDFENVHPINPYNKLKNEYENIPNLDIYKSKDLNLMEKALNN